MTWVTPEQPDPYRPDPEPEDVPMPDAIEPVEESASEPDVPDDTAMDTEEAALPFDEPPIDPLADTNPSLAVRPEGFPTQATDPAPDGDTARDAIPLWRGLVGLVMLLAAAAITFTAGVIVFTPLLNPTVAPVSSDATTEMPAAPPTGVPAQVAAAQVPALPAGVEPVPTLSPELSTVLLSAPVVDLNPVGGPIVRQDSPFTIVPERPRGEVITYKVVEGDTIEGIADSFNLENDTIAWSNSPLVVFALRPGAELNILPVDGVYHQALVPTTIQAIADEYGVDPYDIINSEFNGLFGQNPQTQVPAGARLVVPGGTSTANDWNYNPLVVRTGGGGDSGSGTISFARGEPGSCGSQVNPGGTGYFNAPLASYSWVRGFSAYHTGVDLDAPVGTPVLASSPGRVIYAGWNNWGYGNLVVLAHGPFTTLYGHMDYVTARCGQMVNYGDPVGVVGNTGNSSGPHLHFEIRYNDTATDPTAYVGF